MDDDGSGSAGSSGSGLRASTAASARRAGVPEYSPGQAIRAVIDDIRMNGHSRAAPVYAGKAVERMQRYAAAKGIELGSADLMLSPRQIAHALRDSKRAKGLAVSPEELATFPQRRASMQLYHDRRNNSFVYVDKHAKYIFRGGYSVKSHGNERRAVHFITAQRLATGECFTGKNYEKIK